MFRELPPPIDEESIKLDVLDDRADDKRVPTRLWDEVRVNASVKGNDPWISEVWQ
jgi:hypothetical protein